jgi:hypothetical protein
MSGRMGGQRVREVGLRPSFASSLRVGMRLYWGILSSRGGRGLWNVSHVNVLIGLLSKSAEMVVLALASRCLLLMYKVALCHPNT